MWVNAMCACFWRGRSMPAIRAISQPLLFHYFVGALEQPSRALALALFVLRILANHPYHSVARDDLALVTHFLDRCSYFHNSVSCLVANPSTSPRGLKPRSTDAEMSRLKPRPARSHSRKPVPFPETSTTLP